jgi:hypothetical protein
MISQPKKCIQRDLLAIIGKKYIEILIEITASISGSIDFTTYTRVSERTNCVITVSHDLITTKKPTARKCGRL